MKQFNFFANTVSLLLLICFFSCKKYLDEKADASLIVPNTLKDLQALLDDGTFMNTNTPSMGESSSDDYFLLQASYDALTILQQNVYIWTPYDYKFQNDWSHAYRAVYNSNICLEQIEKIAKTSATELQWNNIKGSALFFRAYYFLTLSWHFSKAYTINSSENDPGIVLRLGSDFNAPSVRSSVKDCYERILADAKSAALYLPENPQHPMRPSKSAAYGLLSRTYLSMRMYDSAGAYADLALQIKSTLMDYNDPSMVTPNAAIPFPRFNLETIFYTTINNLVINYRPALGAKVDTVLYSAYHEDDMRKSVFFKPDGKYFVFKGNYAGDRNALFSGIATDEMYLTRAECHARRGNKEAALNDLNAILSKRWIKGTFIPVISTNAEEVLNIILIERRKELLFRGGLRWMDIKRLNQEDANIVLRRNINGKIYILPANDKRYALPLPIDVIETSTIVQN